MQQKYTLLRIMSATEDSDMLAYKQIELHVVGTAPSDAVQVEDFSISPSTSINAGRAFTSTVRVQNLGTDDLNDVKVTVSIPQLNIQDTEYLDSLNSDQSKTLDSFLLRIPDCATPGTYDLEVTVGFDKYYTTTNSTQITVLSGDTCVANANQANQKAVVTVPDSQEVKAGSDVMFPLLIQNLGTQDKAFTITVAGVESWGSSKISPSSLVVVPAGNSQTVYLDISANDDASGKKMFVVNVASGNDKQAIPLTADVVAPASTAPKSDAAQTVSLKRGLEIALVVLVIILIIVGLVIGFNKLRGQEDEGAQTYY
jgi:uncharacterized membrane protein